MTSWIIEFWLTAVGGVEDHFVLKTLIPRRSLALCQAVIPGGEVFKASASGVVGGNAPGGKCPVRQIIPFAVGGQLIGVAALEPPRDDGLKPLQCELRPR